MTELTLEAPTDQVTADRDTGSSLSNLAEQTAEQLTEKHAETYSVSAQSLGAASFRRDYKVKYAYYAGSMYKGIASKALVIAMARAGMLAFFGTGGLRLGQIDCDLQEIRSTLDQGQTFGVNLLASMDNPEQEERQIDLFLQHGVNLIEASAFVQVTASLVRYRLQGLRRSSTGALEAPNRLIAKVSHPQVAAGFMQPAPAHIIDKLLAQGKITELEAELGREIPVACDICVEADSGGHTDQGVASVLLPAILALRDEVVTTHRYSQSIRVGAAGGIGAPAAAVAAFMLGADFIVTGSINQCSVEAGISDAVKDLLQDMRVEDTAYAPAGDMFEMGAKVQVLKKGLFFPARANKLYELYQRHNSLDELDERTRQQIQDKYFKRSFDEVWEETRAYYKRQDAKQLAAIEKSPKRKMALIFKWYFVHSTRLAMQGSTEQSVDYQVHCGPSLGTFNQWVEGSELADWRQRRVADIADKLMTATAQLLNRRIAAMLALD